VEIIEDIQEWQRRYEAWQRSGPNRAESDYPYVRNRRAPFTPARRALPMLNLALISSAGAYIDGTPEFSEDDLSFKEIPIEVEGSDLRFTARGYDADAVERDLNSQIPVARLLEFERQPARLAA